MSFLEKYLKLLGIRNGWLLTGSFLLFLGVLLMEKEALPGILGWVLFAFAAVITILSLLIVICRCKRHYNELKNNISQLREENIKINGDLNKAIFEIMALYEFTNVLGVSVEYRNMLEQIIDAVQRIINCDRCCLFVYDEDTNELFSRVQRGFPQEIESLKIPLEQFWYGKTLKTGQPILIDDLPREIFRGKLDTFRNLELLGDTKSFIAVPMTVQSKIIGILLIAKDTVAGFSHENLRLLFIIANEAALLIQNTRLYEQVYFSSITDGLTGVYNHKYFREQIELQVKQASEYGFNISLALIDIDHFKSFNDTYGHQVGDIVLKEVARLIQETVPSDCLVARYGGEEFAVIMPDTQCETAVALCENIRNKIANHFFQAEDKALLKVTVSLGVASFPEHIKNMQRMVEELIDLADEYLYYSKDKGRNQVFSPVWKFV